MPWQPSLAELTAPLTRPRPWTLSLEPYRKGIDNARVDCLLGDEFRERAILTMRKLMREDTGGGSRRGAGHLVGADDLAAFRDGYLGLFESALELHPGRSTRDALVLLQLALLKFLLHTAAREGQALLEELKARAETPVDPALYADAQGQLVSGALQSRGLQRRALQLLFRQIRALESGHLRNLRVSVIGRHWPIREPILFNPVLLLPDPVEERALTADYPVAWLDESGVVDWLARTEQALIETFAPYLPPRPGEGSEPVARRGPLVPGHAGRRDQGDLRGFLATEILLDRFVARPEYRQGAATWLDDPGNLKLILSGTQGSGEPASQSLEGPAAALVLHPEWGELRRHLCEGLRAALDAAGLSRVLPLVYALPALRAQLALPLPLSLVLDYAEGRIPKRRLEPRIAALRSNLDPAAIQRAIDRLLLGLKRQDQGLPDETLVRYLVDFATLRRDLKLAYKTFEILDGVRVLEGQGEARLSRTNGSLYEFRCRGEQLAVGARRIRAHAVVKADVRGSTLITEELRSRGLNPASYFSLNFFNPVNALLPEYGAEKLFVEGDAVILALYEYQDEAAGLAVSRACRLARQILRVVTLQNIRNRHNDLPELELGLGISFARREPNFLYDEGRRIMISSAINQADRLSSCSGLLRRSGFAPTNPGFRVAVVRDAVGGERAGPGRDLLTYNVNGVKLDESAYFKLQEELALTQLALPEGESPESKFLVGNYTDGEGRTHWLALRLAPVLDWYGDTLGIEDPGGRHYCEMVVDERLMPRLRRLAE
jgi:hypothetical protein